MAVSPQYYFAASNRDGAGLIHRYDHRWKYLETKALRVEGVDHIGAISHHKGSLWAGWLSTKKPRRSIITEIRAKDLKIVRQFEITEDVTWIDPVCFDGESLWIGDLSDLGIHRYKIDGDRLARIAVYRYPKALHFSQGLQVRDGWLYSIHTFGNRDGLFAFHIADLQADAENEPRHIWPIAESATHLEGFAFAPDKPNQIWHAQGSQVDRWELLELPPATR